MCFCSEVDNSMLTYKSQVTIKSTLWYLPYTKPNTEHKFKSSVQI